MTADELRTLQAPVKQRFKDDPASANRTLRAEGKLEGEPLVCAVKTFLGATPSGLHPSTGGDGSHACAGDMLLQALVGCAGVTLRAVATAMNIPLRGGVVRAEGDLDFRGTMGVSKEVDVGFQAIRLILEIDADATPEQIQALSRLTERYCVVYQTLAKSPRLQTECRLTR